MSLVLDVHLLCIISDRYFKMTHESHADKWKSNLEMHILLQSIFSRMLFFCFPFSVFCYLLSFLRQYLGNLAASKFEKKRYCFFFVSLFLFFSLCTFTKIWFVFETSLVAYDDLGTSNFFHDFSWFQFCFFGILGL